jgi:gluconolactonase
MRRLREREEEKTMVDYRKGFGRLILSALLGAGLWLGVTGTLPAVGQELHGSLQEITPAFQELFPPGAQVEKLAGGFSFIEGPVWNPDGYVLFTDINTDRIHRWSAAEGLTLFRRPSGYANGLTYDRQRRLIACEGGRRRLTRTEADGTITVLANRYNGKSFHSTNDVVVRSDGAIYFTDPPGYWFDPRAERYFGGVYRLSPEGQLTLVAGDLHLPNGLAFSPDEKRLYVNDFHRWQIRVYDVLADGTLANGRFFAELRGPGEGGADGMKVDTRGNVYSTGPGGVWVFDPAGTLLGKILMKRFVANCAWGDADGKTLYLTASDSLYRIRAGIAGIRP